MVRSLLDVLVVVVVVVVAVVVGGVDASSSSSSSSSSSRFHPETSPETGDVPASSTAWRAVWHECTSSSSSLSSSSSSTCAALRGDERVHVHLRLVDRGVCTREFIEREVYALSDPASPRYGRHWSAERLCSVCGGGGVGMRASLEAVARWIDDDLADDRHARASVRVEPLPCSEWATLSAPAAVLERMLGGVRLARYAPHAHVSAAVGGDAFVPVVRARDDERRYTLPTSLRGHVRFVADVHRFPRPHGALTDDTMAAAAAAAAASAAAAAADSLSSSSSSSSVLFDVDARARALGRAGNGQAVQITPQRIHTQYNISAPPPTPSASANNTQAVVSFLKQYFSPLDFSSFAAQYGLPFQVPAIAAVLGPNDPSHPGVEASLDVQYLTGVGTGVETWVWSTSGLSNVTGQEPFVVWLTAVFARMATGASVPNVFSISYQDFEDTTTVEFATAVSDDFARLGMLGVTLVTGSGDWGVGGKCSLLGECQAFRPDFPSSSPYIVSSGATQLNTDLSESSIYFSSGGFSNIFAQFPAQRDAVERFVTSQRGSLPPQHLWNATGRAFPDIAAFGVDFQVVVGQRTMPVGGTSAATPTFAGIVSLLNDARLRAGQPTMGWIVPFLYANADAFADVARGDANPDKCCHEGFRPVAGWDPISGLGSVRYNVMLERALRGGGGSSGSGSKLADVVNDAHTSTSLVM